MTASHVFTVRLTALENTALEKSATRYKLKRSQIVKRLLRELLRGRPDYFEAEKLELRKLNRGITAIGRNLNQIARTLNSDKSVPTHEISEELELTRANLQEIKLYIQAEIESATRRTVKVLSVPELEE